MPNSAAPIGEHAKSSPVQTAKKRKSKGGKNRRSSAELIGLMGVGAVLGLLPEEGELSDQDEIHDEKRVVCRARRYQ